MSERILMAMSGGVDSSVAAALLVLVVGSLATAALAERRELSLLAAAGHTVFAAGERVLVFTHFAEWGKRLADHLTEVTGVPIACYHGGLARGARDKLIADFQGGEGPGALVLSLKAGGTGLNLTAASHVVLYDRWWNPAVEDQARDRAWRIGQERTVISHRLVCPGTVDERVEEVVAGKRHIADMVLPRSSSLADLDANRGEAARLGEAGWERARQITWPAAIERLVEGL